MDAHDEKMLLCDYYNVWIKRGLFEKQFQSAGQENYLLCVYPRFSLGIRLVNSLHDWCTFVTLAADKNSNTL